MNFLIWTQAADMHSIAVERALRAQGHQVDRLFSADIPVLSSLSFRFESGRTTVHHRHRDGSQLTLDHNLVWLRRPSPAHLETEVHPKDLELARAECGALVEGLWLSSCPNAVWVNTPTGQRNASSKVLQLQTARNVGLTIPRTLISNNPEAIRSFLADNVGGSIYKSFLPDRWGDGQRVRAKMRTTAIDAGRLPSDRTLRLTPGIFQEEIHKSFEVRVTVFDGHVIAARLDTQSSRGAVVDSKDVPIHAMNVQPIEPPATTQCGIIALMSALGIRFGCLDFIVRDGEWIFLEVNQMGQFLWIEMACPEIRMLSTFTQFLVAAASKRYFVPTEDDVSLKAVLDADDIKAVMVAEVAAHRSHYPPPHPF